MDHSKWIMEMIDASSLRLRGTNKRVVIQATGRASRFIISYIALDVILDLKRYVFIIFLLLFKIYFKT